MAAVLDMDELEALMPRTKAANDRAQVDAHSLQQYMEASKVGTPNMISKRSSVMVRGDVRKDDQGFEDIDDERRVRMSAAPNNDVDVDNDFEFGNDGYQSTDTMDLDDDPDIAQPLSSKKSKESSSLKTTRRNKPSPAQAPATPVRSSTAAARPQYSKRSTASSPAPSHDFNTSMSFDTGSAMKAIPIPSKRDNHDLESVRQLIARKSLQPKSPLRAPRSRDNSPLQSDGKRKRGLFGAENDGFLGASSSPFSPGVSPLSNASARGLDVAPFSAEQPADGAGSSSSIKVKKKLFKMGDRLGKEQSAKASKGRAAAKAPRKAPAKQSKKAAKRAAAAAGADESADQQTDNDKSFTANTSDEDNDNDGDSDYKAEKSTKARGRHSSAHARDMFDDTSDDDGDDAAGVRRSKRRRFKPLAWYKGEHYVYERRESGVGLVIPTVAGIERVGTTTPTKTARTYTKRAGAALKSRAKALPRSQLPKGLRYETGEWANLYDTVAGCVNRMNVICRASEIEHRELPSVEGERPGFAGQSFNLRSSHPFSRWICGRLGLPPGAAKEAESVGDAVQVFYVTSCQPGAVEVSFGPVTDEYFDTGNATRFLLNPGDEFYVPSRNAYYLKNYSGSTACELHFTIMKPDLPAIVVTAPSAAANSSSAAGASDSGSPDFRPRAADANVNVRRAKKQKRLKP
ncbi:hypothetical protein PybrP1_007136 [[Pythium] brassicae (nom. inval.)]|nr:hypothetical protein PybrP1_007136 [[Pythium] brassicae (nom. inval.)]